MKEVVFLMNGKNISMVKLVNLKEKFRKLNVWWIFNMNCNFFVDKFIFIMIIWYKIMIYINWLIVVYYVKVMRKKIVNCKDIFFWNIFYELFFLVIFLYEFGYELISNYVNNYFIKEGIEYYVKLEIFNNRLVVLWWYVIYEYL